jgi:hypothetical protein
VSMGFCGRRAKEVRFVLHVPRPMSRGEVAEHF